MKTSSGLPDFSALIGLFGTMSLTCGADYVLICQYHPTPTPAGFGGQGDGGVW